MRTRGSCREPVLTASRSQEQIRRPGHGDRVEARVEPATPIGRLPGPKAGLANWL